MPLFGKKKAVERTEGGASLTSDAAPHTSGGGAVSTTSDKANPFLTNQRMCVAACAAAATCPLFSHTHSKSLRADTYTDSAVQTGCLCSSLQQLTPGPLPPPTHTAACPPAAHTYLLTCPPASLSLSVCVCVHTYIHSCSHSHGCRSSSACRPAAAAAAGAQWRVHWRHPI